MKALIHKVIYYLPMLALTFVGGLVLLISICLMTIESIWTRVLSIPDKPKNDTSLVTPNP